MSFHLLHDRVAVLPDEVAETTESGLILSESAQSPLRFGTITHVGTGHTSDYTGEPVQIWLAAGARVFYHRHSGQTLEIEGTEYVILAPNEVIGWLDA